VVFSKTGRLRFLGQLDLGRTLDRALRRSGLPVRFSEGFHPRIRLSFPCASPTGMASTCELVEIQVRPPAGSSEVLEGLREALPPELAPLGAGDVPPGERVRLAAARYVVGVREGGPDLPDSRAVAALVDRREVPVLRRGKSVDLRPFVEDLRREEGALRMRLAFAESGATVRPEDVLGALEVDPLAFRIERTGMILRLRGSGAEERLEEHGT